MSNLIINQTDETGKGLPINPHFYQTDRYQEFANANPSLLVIDKNNQPVINRSDLRVSDKIVWQYEISGEPGHWFTTKNPSGGFKGDFNIYTDYMINQCGCVATRRVYLLTDPENTDKGNVKCFSVDLSAYQYFREHSGAQFDGDVWYKGTIDHVVTLMKGYAKFTHTPAPLSHKSDVEESLAKRASDYSDAVKPNKKGEYYSWDAIDKAYIQGATDQEKLMQGLNILSDEELLQAMEKYHDDKLMQGEWVKVSEVETLINERIKSHNVSTMRNPSAEQVNINFLLKQECQYILTLLRNKQQ